MYDIVISAKLESNVRSLASLAILEPLRPTVKELVAAAPVPSLIVTVSPALGDAGKVMVMLAAVTVTNSPTAAV